GRTYSMRCGWARGLVTHTSLASTQLSPCWGSVVMIPIWSKALFIADPLARMASARLGWNDPGKQGDNNSPGPVRPWGGPLSHPQFGAAWPTAATTAANAAAAETSMRVRMIRPMVNTLHSFSRLLLHHIPGR